MKKAFIKKLEKEFDISISNFEYFSGNNYKASFDVLLSVDGKNTTINVVVKDSETYKKAIERAIFRVSYFEMDL